MPSNAAPYLRPLSQWEEYPAFPEVRELVMKHSIKKSKWLILTPVLEGFVLLLISAALVLQTGPSQPVSTVNVTQFSSATASVTPAPITNAHITSTHSKVNIAQPIATKTFSQNSTTADPLSVKNDPEYVISETPVLRGGEPIDLTAAHSAASILSVPITNEVERRLWSFILSGGPALVQSKAMNASLSVRYQLSGEWSALAELRRSALHGTSTFQQTGYRDSLITMNGQPYYNTFTTNSTQTISIQNPVTLGGGVRWEMSAADVIPFFETSVGTNLSGLLASISGGLRFEYSKPVSFDVSVRTDRFISPLISPISEIGLNAAIEYAW